MKKNSKRILPIFLVGLAVPPANLVLRPGETILAKIEFYLTVPDGDLEFEIYESDGNLVSFFCLGN